MLVTLVTKICELVISFRVVCVVLNSFFVCSLLKSSQSHKLFNKNNSVRVLSGVLGVGI